MLFRTIIIAMFLATSGAMADEIKVGTDPWCPYNCKDSKQEGINIEVVRKIFEPHGHKVTVRYMPWARAVKSLKDGKITNFTSAAKADCPECIYADTPTTYMQNTIFIRAEDKTQWKGLDSLKGKVIGVINNYTYGEELTSYVKKHSGNESMVQTTSGPHALHSNIKKLVKGRIDFTVDEVSVLTYTSNQLNLKHKIKPIHTISSVPLYLGFSPKDPKGKEYAALASKTLRQMKKDGTLAKIFEKYGVTCLSCSSDDNEVR